VSHWVLELRQRHSLHQLPPQVLLFQRVLPSLSQYLSHLHELIFLPLLHPKLLSEWHFLCDLQRIYQQLRHLHL
jgi:hypothetical protein